MPCGPDEFQTGSGHAAAGPRLRRRPRTRPRRRAAVDATSRPRAPRLQVQAFLNVAPLAREGRRAAPRPKTKCCVASTTSRLSSNRLVEGFRPRPMEIYHGFATREYHPPKGAPAHLAQHGEVLERRNGRRAAADVSHLVCTRECYDLAPWTANRRRLTSQLRCSKVVLRRLRCTKPL